MKWLRDDRLRPALWGFFISMVLVGALGLFRWLWPMKIQSGWDDERLRVEQSDRETVGKIFRERLDGLLSRASGVVRDDSLLPALLSNVPRIVRTGFVGLDGRRDDPNVTIDIVDPRGRVLSWAGRKVFAQVPQDVGLSNVDTVVFTTETSLHSFLSVGLRAEASNVFVVVSAPLELNYPISNRFLTRVSFSEELSDALGRGVRLLLSGKSRADQQAGATRIVLEDYGGKTVAVALLSRLTEEGYMATVGLRVQSLMAAVIGIASILLIFIFWRGLAIVHHRSLRILFLTFLLWSVRYLWVVIGFPADVAGGQLFDSFLFGTPFAGGLSSSPGETLISSGMLFLNILLVVRMLDGRFSSGSSGRLIGPLQRVGGLSALVVSFVLLLILTRGYGALHRSFVFDSAIRYYDSSGLVPDGMTTVMVICIVLVSAALILLYCMVIGESTEVIGRLFPGRFSRMSARIVLFLIYSVLSMLFLALLPGSLVPFFYPSMVFVVAGAIVFVHERNQKKRLPPFAMIVRQTGLILLASFVLSVPLLDGYIHEKERENMAMIAREVVRPAGSWLPFVLSEGLQQIIDTEIQAENGEEEDSPARRNAFRLWAQTLMSSEGYNSAVVLYDTEGNETSRFAVGLTSYEQRELLERIFELDEEIPRAIERRVPGGLIRYYGTWGTLRDAAGRVTGYVAVMLSASQQALFRGEGTDLLKTVGGESGAEIRATVYAEYEDSVLVFSNSPAMIPGSPLPMDILAALGSNHGEGVFRNLRLDNQSYDAVYLRDVSEPARIVVVGVSDRGIRWHVFYGVKIFLVFVAVSVFLLFVSALAYWKYLRTRTFGFRAKLVSAFLVLTFVPLVLLAYYNREFTVERIDASTGSSLREDLDLLQRRIAVLVRNEEDFVRGVDNDFCDAIADELAIDFSVFRQFELQASSRPELYSATILDSRLNGTAFSVVVLEGRPFFSTVQQVGDVRYTVGYAPIIVGDRAVGVLSVPMLYKQAEIEAELAERNASMISIYAIILGLVAVVGFVMANTLSRPLRELTNASRRVGSGRLDVSLKRRSSDEIGELFDSFNEMVLELRKNREELSRVEREAAWREMAKQVAHEIKNPLTPMKLSLQHLRQAFRDKAKNIDEIVERVSKTVMDQVDTLARIATEFSHFARMPDRRFERVDVHQVLKESVSLFDHVSGVQFRPRFSAATPVVIADRDELRRVFVNVLRNSIQAMEAKGTISVETVIDGPKCVIRFSDTGSGMSQGVLEKVFEPNFSTKSDGMGLGLAISQRVIHDLDGTIAIRSAVGAGTTVEIALPLWTPPHE